MSNWKTFLLKREADEAPFGFNSFDLNSPHHTQPKPTGPRHLYGIHKQTHVDIYQDTDGSLYVLNPEAPFMDGGEWLAVASKVDVSDGNLKYLSRSTNVVLQDLRPYNWQP